MDHLCIFFGAMSVQMFCLFLNWVLLLSSKSSLHTLDISLIRYLICKYFLQFCMLSPHFLSGVLWSAKGFHLMMCDLFILYMFFWIFFGEQVLSFLVVRYPGLEPLSHGYEHVSFNSWRWTVFQRVIRIHNSSSSGWVFWCYLFSSTLVFLNNVCWVNICTWGDC